jgi:hypothetical protein
LSDSSERPRDFIPVDSEAEARSLLREGAKTLASAMLWTKDQTHVLQTHVSHYSESDQHLCFWIPKETDPKQLVSGLAELGEKECFFSISLPRANIFFKASFLGLEKAGFMFKLPSRIFKVQRRKDLRFAVPDGHILKATFQDPLQSSDSLTRKVHDISAGGVSLVISEEDRPLFPAGTVLKEFFFIINGRRIACEGEVRHVKRVTADSRNPGLRAGVMFKRLRAADEQWIASYVFEESRKYYSRFL